MMTTEIIKHETIKRRGKDLASLRKECNRDRFIFLAAAMILLVITGYSAIAWNTPFKTLLLLFLFGICLTLGVMSSMTLQVINAITRSK